MPPTEPDLRVVGGGLAGCEAAFAAAARGLSVRLYEMKPQRRSPAHQSDSLAELVCSNSLRSDDPATGPGLLKAEMRMAGSVVLEAADACKVPAGGALAVDRNAFAERITQRIESHPSVEVVRDEVLQVPRDRPIIVATGPLTDGALANSIAELTGGDSLHFADATAPIVDASTISESVCFRASRYDKGDADYLNCPMNQEEYEAFVAALLAADKVPLRGFEETKYFEGCMPIEEMARRGPLTLAHGPMKPVGLIDPRTGTRPFAVVQLRAENRFASMYNLVGFQTQMTWTEQRRVLRMIPGLENAEFLRLGTIHRNTFLRSPLLLDDRLRLRSHPRIRFAGQITGVEGYIESAATGYLAGVFAAADYRGQDVPAPPAETAHGCLIRHLTESDAKRFQPMNINFGLMPPLEKRLPKKLRKPAYRDRALPAWEAWIRRIA